MHKFRWIAPLVLIFILLVPQAAQASVPKPSADEYTVLKQINKARKARHLKPLRMEARLTRIARWMDRDMIKYDYFAHTDHLGRDPFKRMDAFGYKNLSWRGENIAAGNNDPLATYSQWWHSKPHKKNMLSPHYKYIGIARVCKEGSTYTCYWATEFGGHFTQGFN